MNPYSNNKSEKVRRAIALIQTQGLTFYAQNYLKRKLHNRFLTKKQLVKLNADNWKNINFKALNLHGSGKILLNPLDMGFSREFNVYGFREPLNSFAFFCDVAKRNLWFWTLEEI